MSAAEKQENPWEKPPGLMGMLTVLDSQEIGKLFMGTALIFFLLAGIMALLMRAQLAHSESHLIGPEVYNRLFTMHGSTMMYLVVVPFLEGLGIYLLPLILGSRDVAFPYVTAFSYWTYLFGGVTFYCSFLLGVEPNVGWFAYPPLANLKYSGMGTDFWSLALSLVSIGDLAAGTGLTITVLKLRAPGMSLNRIPVFAWAWVVTGAMIAFAFTTLFNITTLMLPLDRTIGTHFFDPERGGSPLLWQHLFWFFGHPEVYIMFIPATGIVSSVLPVFAKRPIVAYSYVVVATVLIAFLSFGLWVHHMFTTGIPWLSMTFFMAASLMIAMASGTQVFAWIATLWKSRPRLDVPMLYMLGFLSLFVLGGITGVMVAVVPFDWQVHDTYFLVAHFHYVLIGGVVFPTLGGIYYWLPKMTGRMLNATWGKVSFWLVFLGFNAAFFPMHIMGLRGMPRRVYTYSPSLGLDALNLLSTLGAYVLAVGFLVFILDAWWSAKNGPPAPADPWQADTLEWLLPSPAPEDNHRVPPLVHSRHPLWSEQSMAHGTPEEERVREVLANTPRGWRIALVTSILEAAPTALQPWPKPSLVPFVISAGLELFLLGTLAKSPALMILGGLVTVVTLVKWYGPDDHLLETLRKAELDKRTGLPLVSSGIQSMDGWGLICCLCIIVTIYGNLFYSYFYTRLYSPMWPQDHLPRPHLLASGLLFGLLILSGLALVRSGRAFKADQGRPAAWWISACLALETFFLTGQLVSLSHEGFTPQTNAYGSLFYLISWLFAATVLAGIGTKLAALRRLWKEGTDKGRYVALQMERAQQYGAFTIGMGVLVWIVLYVSPQF